MLIKPYNIYDLDCLGKKRGGHISTIVSTSEKDAIYNYLIEECIGAHLKGYYKAEEASKESLLLTVKHLEEELVNIKSIIDTVK